MWEKDICKNGLYIYVVGWDFLRKNAPDNIYVRMARFDILHICCRLGLSSKKCARQHICKNGADMDRKPRNAQFTDLKFRSGPDTVALRVWPLVAHGSCSAGMAPQEPSVWGQPPLDT